MSFMQFMNFIHAPPLLICKLLSIFLLSYNTIKYGVQFGLMTSLSLIMTYSNATQQNVTSLTVLLLAMQYRLDPILFHSGKNMYNFEVSNIILYLMLQLKQFRFTSSSIIWGSIFLELSRSIAIPSMPSTCRN